MKMAVLANIYYKIPPEKYGGTELVIYSLIKNLVEMGETVYLIGTGDSKTKATLLPIVPRALHDVYAAEELRLLGGYYQQLLISEMLKNLQEIRPDVIFNHAGWLPVWYEKFLPGKMFTTTHGPLIYDSERKSYEDHNESAYVSISDNQRKALPGINWAATIYNGIEVENFEVGTAYGRDYFAFLGRISPEKGVKELCEMVKKTDQKLKIAAKIDLVDIAYYENEVKPLIDGEQIEFIGEVDHAGKVELLKKAKALLLWLNWEEPFGLVVVEAMACGTPVIVNRRGSMRELVVDGKTGFLVSTIDEMRERMADVRRLSIEDCRQLVEHKFSARRMAKEYFELAVKMLG